MCTYLNTTVGRGGVRGGSTCSMFILRREIHNPLSLSLSRVLSLYTNTRIGYSRKTSRCLRKGICPTTFLMPYVCGRSSVPKNWGVHSPCLLVFFDFEGI